MRLAANECAHFDVALEPILAREPNMFGAPWLKSPLESPVWDIGVNFDSTIDFRVRLNDDSMLTDAKNQELLRTIKHFLLAQSDITFTKGILYSDTSLSARILAAIHISEYLLVRSEEFNLGAFGLRAITEADALKMLKRIAEEDAADSVYQWHDRLSRLLVEKGAGLSERALATASSLQPGVALADECPRLGMSAQQVARARAWLWTNDFYKAALLDGVPGYGLDSGKIIDLLHPRGTLKKTWMRPRIAELEILRGPALHRELRGCPVRAEERSVAALRLYRRSIRALPKLETLSLYVPQALVDAGENLAFIEGLDARPVGRYTSLPVSTVLDALKSSIEFILEYAEDLIAAYLSFAKEGIRKSLRPFQAANLLDDIITPKLQALGVCSWSVAHNARMECLYGPGDVPPVTTAKFFARMRANEGLYELLQVLWGALLVALGALTARRQGELVDLKVGSLFDRSGTRLAFLARKRNEREFREVLHRPIPPVLASILRNFEQMHEELSRLGIAERNGSLLGFPRMSAFELCEPRDDVLNFALDRFCDYFQIGSDAQGQRRYIRQHQLRRFFALLFFWGSSFGGLDTLRWFLGHVDAQQLYRYITESTPGEVLRSTKVDYVIEQIHRNDASAEPVVDIVRRRFGVDAVQLLDVAELAGYLEELMAEETIEVEPHFFSTHACNEYMIMIIVKERST